MSAGHGLYGGRTTIYYQGIIVLFPILRWFGDKSGVEIVSGAARQWNGLGGDGGRTIE